VSLEITDLSVEIAGRTVVDGLSLSVGPDERVGLIGESGSGKSMTLLAVLGLLPDEAVVRGSVSLDGRELVGLPDRDHAPLRGAGIGVVFQDPTTSLNPVRTIGRQIAEPLRLHEGLGRREARRRAIEAAAPGGPRLLLADEPTTALDVSTQAEVLDLFARLVDERGASLLFVTHDLAVLRRATDRAAVLADGRVVEEASVDDLLHRPRHAVTRGLVEATRATTWRAR
jgi:peptide/nickel transport system ATP-binding protein